MNIQTYNNQLYIDIVPIQTTFKDLEECTRLFITQITDTLTNSAIIYWELHTTPVEEIYEEGALIVSGIPGITYLRRQYTMTEKEYELWGTDLEYPFTILLRELNLKTP